MFESSRTGSRFHAGIVVFVSCVAAALAAAHADPARPILEAAGSASGLIVHLGSGDGRLTAALCQGENTLVHGLDTDADRVALAREHIREMGLYGPVSVDRFDGKRLPYADNLINLLVAEDLGGIALDEAMRVLAPGGALCRKRDGRWQKTVKPRPADIDEWTHYMHDPSGNAVARDERVGPPRRLQWNAEPRHARSHEHTPSINAVVSTGGRIFYIVDQTPVASLRQAPRWRLVARDAFNGILLWEVPVATWYPHLINWGQAPSQLQRKLVAVGDRVYVTLGYFAPVSAVDAATGETLTVYEGTQGTEEIVLHEGVLLLVVRDVTDERVAEVEKWARLARREGSPVYDRDTAEPLVTHFRTIEREARQSLLALDAESGRLLWKKEDPDTRGLRTLSLCAQGDRVFCQTGKGVICLDLKTGREQWSTARGPLRLVHGDLLVCASGKEVSVLSAQTGKPRWTREASLCDVRDAFVIRGAVWLGGFKPWEGRTTGKRGPSWGPYFAVQYDLGSGEILMQVEPENPGHHHRCYLNKATERYILGGRRGTEFIDLESGEVLWNSWARGVCKYGVMPCNGLLYAPAHACGCYVAAKLTGFNALASKSGQYLEPNEQGPRLQPGPAYEGLLDAGSFRVDPSADWPTYRHDAGRSGSTATAVPAELRPRWQAEIGGRLTGPTVAGGKVFVASVDAHRVLAVDADSGGPVWHFTAGARVDSPPTLHDGRAVFGCRDGYVYSLDAATGRLAWRLQAARDDRRITARGQLESVSPSHGSVLVDGGVLYVTAGRNSYLDGGIDLHRVNLRTGKILSTTTIYSPDPETGRQPPQFAPAAMPGTRSDLLSADAEHVYLRDTVFGKDGRASADGEPHLFTLTDYLDDDWPHRSYWIFGTQCSLATGCSGRDRNLIYGRLLVFDDATICGYGRKSVHWSNLLQDGPYRLFAVKRGETAPQWEKPLPIHVRAMVRAGAVLFVAGPAADAIDGPWQLDERRPASLLAVSAADGTVLARRELAADPVFDGMAAARGRLYVALENGQMVCLDGAVP